MVCYLFYLQKFIVSHRYVNFINCTYLRFLLAPYICTETMQTERSRNAGGSGILSTVAQYGRSLVSRISVRDALSDATSVATKSGASTVAQEQRFAERRARITQETPSEAPHAVTSRRLLRLRDRRRRRSLESQG